VVDLPVVFYRRLTMQMIRFLLTSVALSMAIFWGYFSVLVIYMVCMSKDAPYEAVIPGTISLAIILAAAAVPKWRHLWCSPIRDRLTKFRFEGQQKA
jgi:hypothetical protein